MRKLNNKRRLNESIPDSPLLHVDWYANVGDEVFWEISEAIFNAMEEHVPKGTDLSFLEKYVEIVEAELWKRKFHYELMDILRDTWEDYVRKNRV